MRIPNFSKVFILHINWSALSIGVIIDQIDEKGKEFVIAYASRNNNKAESNYFSYEGECFAIVWAIIHLGSIFMAPSSLCIPTTSLLSV
jgi:hypothetical protein